ncbi:DUF5988 family protein [Kitasatospora sp. NPDC008050]|uniref:DUF5988 family protein n=1 Tax=Kitasatospora sp. NPDC008050 TaxID=3364021 RepID=UPI0036E25D52
MLGNPDATGQAGVLYRGGTALTSTERSNALLRGGPRDMSAQPEYRYVEEPTEKVKIFQGNYYDHYEPTAESELHGGRPCRVYVWTGRTYVAE